MGSRDWVVAISPEMALEMMPHETFNAVGRLFINAIPSSMRTF